MTTGKFCFIGPGVTFIMNGANHRIDGSTSPFNIFGNGWEKHTPTLDMLPLKGDTVIGYDVWIGLDATIMPIFVGDHPKYNVEASKNTGTVDVWKNKPTLGRSRGSQL